ncbi:MAG: ParB/RepB/Spo0J family partition protein [Clostridia bacterium]|nr:ParB/RepB/Spo0J family partition protein [Clostridia bacterium]
MAQQKGLGRGFASLLGMNDVELEPKSTTMDAPIEIELEEIDPNYEQPRKNFDQESLQELANSITQHGVIQPIILTKIGTRYMIIAGERRFRASKLAGKSTIPAIVRNYTPQQVREISLVENLQRDDLNAIEAARAIKELMTSFNLTQESVADRLGKSRPAIANTLRLLSLNDKVIALIEEGKLSSGHGRALVVVVNPVDQYRLALKVVENKLSVRETEKAVRDLLNPTAVKVVEKPPISIELKELVENMTRAFATKVSAIGNDEKGRIHIDYFTKDDLDRICALIDDWNKRQEN